MKIKEKIISVFFTGLILMGMAASLWAADISTLEAQTARLKVQQETLKRDRQVLFEQGRHLASEIDALKQDTKDGLGMPEQRRLTKKLQESIELSQNIEALDRQINGLAEQIIQKTEELKNTYETEIAALMRQIEGADGPTKEKLITQAMRYLSAKLKLEEPVSPSSPVPMNGMEISTKDGPEEIREKADLISDMVDKLKAELAQVDRRLRDLKREKKMRRKMQEFVEEISFFDEDMAQGRTVQPQKGSRSQLLDLTDNTGPGGISDDHKSPGDDEWGGSIPGPSAAPMIAHTYADPIYRIEVEDLSSGNLERGIDSLMVKKKRLEETSSALLKKAERFYNKAKMLE